MFNEGRIIYMKAVESMLKYLEEQNLQKAKAQFEIIKSAGSDEDKYNAALELARFGYLEEAKELYEHILKNYNDDGEIIVSIAELLVELDREDEAYQYLSMVKPDDPNYPAALLLEADLYEMQGLYEVSENKLKQAKQMLPHEPVIDYALAELFLTQGRFLEASRIFKELLDAKEFTVADVDINSRMAEALSAGGAFEEALVYYENALKNKKEINVLFGYGLTSYQSGNYKKAIDAFTELREIDPEYHSLYLYLAHSFEHEERLEEALDTVVAGMKVDEFNKELYHYAGKLALKLGNEEDGENYLRQAIVLDPEFTEAGLTLNKLLLHQERYEDVLEISKMFSDGVGDDAQFHWDAALSYQNLEQYSLALNEYEVAYNEVNNNNEFLKDYGYFLLEEGRRSEATIIFKKLKENDPTNEEWISILERLEE